MSNKNFTSILTLVFFILGLIGILRHEMWFDELQAWLIARDSLSLVNLFKNVRYEGQPGLWHLCLYIISRFSRDPILMQFLHLGIATLAIYIFVNFSPFSKVQKVLFVFGYFPFYEYCLISRGYGLGVMFIFLFCALFSAKKKSCLALLATIAVLANTNIIALLVAVSLLATLIFEQTRNIKKNVIVINKQNIVAGIIACCFGLLAIYQILPPPDRSYGQIDLSVNPIANKSHEFTGDFSSGVVFDIVADWSDKITEIFKLIWKSFVPVPNFMEYQFWGRNILEEFPFALRLSAGLIAACLILYLLILFSNYSTVFFLYSFGTSLLLVFVSIVPAASKVRHLGYLFILSVACLWLLNNYLLSNPRDTRVSGLRLFARKHQTYFFNVILLLHVFAGMFSYINDLIFPFTVSRKVASYIKDQQLDKLTIVGSPDFPVASLSAYLDQRIYYPFSDRFGTYVIYDKARNEGVDSSLTLVERIEKVQRQHQKDVLLVLTQETRQNFLQEISSSNRKLPIERLTSFGKSIVFPESYYYLYLIKFPSLDGEKI
ncbi:MAG: hypothetical protein ACFB4I_16585 [Cyanophyceae cyanobacterium]